MLQLFCIFYTHLVHDKNRPHLGIPKRLDVQRHTRPPTHHARKPRHREPQRTPHRPRQTLRATHCAPIASASAGIERRQTHPSQPYSLSPSRPRPAACLVRPAAPVRSAHPGASPPPTRASPPWRPRASLPDPPWHVEKMGSHRASQRPGSTPSASSGYVRAPAGARPRSIGHGL